MQSTHIFGLVLLNKNKITGYVIFFLQNSRISSVRHALNSLTSSAARLQEECQDTNMGDLEPELDLPFKTQQVMQCAFDIARAAKQLVTLFQWECSKDSLNERSDVNTVRGSYGELEIWFGAK